MPLSRVQDFGELELWFPGCAATHVDGKQVVAKLSFRLELLPEHIKEDVWRLHENRLYCGYGEERLSFRSLTDPNLCGTAPISHDVEQCYLPLWLGKALLELKSNLGLGEVRCMERTGDRRRHTLELEWGYPGCLIEKPFSYIERRVIPLLQRHLPQ